MGPFGGMVRSFFRIGGGLWQPLVLQDLHIEHNLRYRWLLFFNLNELVAPLFITCLGVADCERDVRHKNLFKASCLASAGVGAVAYRLHVGASDTYSTTLLGVLGAIASCLGMVLWVLLYAWTPELYPVSMRSTSFGVTMTLNRIASALSPVVAAWMFARLGLSGPALMSAGGFMLVGVTSLLWTNPKTRRSHEEPDKPIEKRKSQQQLCEERYEHAPQK